MENEATWRFDNSLVRALEGFFVPAQVERAPAPRLTILNRALAEALGLALPLDDAEHLLVGNALPVEAEPVALAYAGHQFGGFSPVLGDGRALLLGEIVAPDGRRFDLQFKGSGRTPFSRGGDGKLALGPALREYLISEAMAALCVPTTRILSVVETGEVVQRDQPHPGAVALRVAASHLRVGTFEWAARAPGTDALRQLADYALLRHYPAAAHAPNPYLALVEAVMDAQIALVAQWMSLGFVHGVMNTDNVAISGEAIDYGPCAFLDAYSAREVFSSIDRQGRYAFGNQSAICHWNMVRLASALLALIEAVDAQGVAQCQALLDTFPARFRRAWVARMRPKFGLFSDEEDDAALVEGLFAALEGQRVDFTNLFRALATSLTQGDDVVRDLLREPYALDDWLADWHARLAREEPPPEERAAQMNAVNPLYIPRNHMVDAALSAAEAGDMVPFMQVLEVVTHPYVERADWADYAQGAPADAPHHVTYCGT
ncbi:MAG: YdiU family protein [Alphaproteobacteria bacterium]|nr:YdiU family protein [Alphaproteobacteria bacterium]MDE2041523.1 YdiU family protein [Alphaproteobacteria bacterium]MDE2341631.1 YdiU family protein [Alphaproteobacteria bacterium]